MLNIDFRPSFTRTAKALVPSGTGFEEQSFSATFEALDIPEFTAFDLTTADGTKEFLERVLIGADDVVDAKGSPVPFSLFTRDRLLARSEIRQGLVEAYLKGFQQAAEGN